MHERRPITPVYRVTATSADRWSCPFCGTSLFNRGAGRAATLDTPRCPYCGSFSPWGASEPMPVKPRPAKGRGSDP